MSSSDKKISDIFDDDFEVTYEEDPGVSLDVPSGETRRIDPVRSDETVVMSDRHTGISTEIAPAENVLTTMKTILTMSMMMKTTTMMSMKTGGDAVVPLDMMMTMMMTEAAEILPDAEKEGDGAACPLPLRSRKAERYCPK